MSTPAAIFLFDRTGNMARPWAEAGNLCYCVDLQHPKGETVGGQNMIFVGQDARHWRAPVGIDPIFAAAFPPCTHLAVSGARWFKGKGLRLLSEAIELFAVAAEVCEWAGCPYLIENPVSVVSSHWRKPDFTFDPWEYAGYLEDQEEENTTKRTCLWTGGASSCLRSDPLKLHTATTCGKWHRVKTGPTTGAEPQWVSREPCIRQT